MERPSEPVRASTLVIAAVVFYGLMSIAAVLMLTLSDVDAGTVVFGTSASERSPDAAPPDFDHLGAALLGAGTGLAVVGLSYLLRRVKPLQRLQKELGSLLGEQSTGTIAVLAVTSAVGEELLFRGALLPLIGFWPTAILFGLLHGGGAPKLIVWTIFAFLSGLLLAWLAQVTGSLLAPILCHLTINFWNLQALGHPPEAEAA